MIAPRKIQSYGWRKDSLDHRDKVFAPPAVDDSWRSWPVVLSMRKQFPAPYDQSQLGSCTGNGVAGILEYQAMRQGEGAITPSRLYIYYHERVIEGTVNQDAGAEIRDGLKVVANLGCPPESDWPYNINMFAVAPTGIAEQNATMHKAIQYQTIVPGPGAPIRHALAAGHPVVFGFSVPDYFETEDYSQTYLRVPTANNPIIGGHCVVIIGWDYSRKRFPVNVLECRNSWGTDWGDNGHFYMDARWFNDPNLTSDFWIITRTT